MFLLHCCIDEKISSDFNDMKKFHSATFPDRSTCTHGGGGSEQIVPIIISPRWDRIDWITFQWQWARAQHLTRTSEGITLFSEVAWADYRASYQTPVCSLVIWLPESESCLVNSGRISSRTCAMAGSKSGSCESEKRKGISWGINMPHDASTMPPRCLHDASTTPSRPLHQYYMELSINIPGMECFPLPVHQRITLSFLIPDKNLLILINFKS